MKLLFAEAALEVINFLVGFRGNVLEQAVCMVWSHVCWNMVVLSRFLHLNDTVLIVTKYCNLLEVFPKTATFHLHSNTTLRRRHHPWALKHPFRRYLCLLIGEAVHAHVNLWSDNFLIGFDKTKLCFIFHPNENSSFHKFPVTRMCLQVETRFACKLRVLPLECDLSGSLYRYLKHFKQKLPLPCFSMTRT